MTKLHRSFAVVPLRWTVSAGFPAMIHAAAVAVEQILANGLTNSCKFCRQEGGEIRVSVEVAPIAALAAASRSASPASARTASASVRSLPASSSPTSAKMVRPSRTYMQWLALRE
jgi:hypothetical protein